MSDLEMVKACAEAMGFIAERKPVYAGPGAADPDKLLGHDDWWRIPEAVSKEFPGVPYAICPQWHWNPLTNDGQAMALGKAFPHEFATAIFIWSMHIRAGQPFGLNYELCGRVAHLHQSKTEG